MKVKTNSIAPTIKSEGLTGTTMGLHAENAHMAAFFLRDKIYSDKELAVCREYISNAVDEHITKNVGEDTPVSVTLTDSEFRVRDFANGLSDHDVRYVFGSYFNSQKDDNNEGMGGFGIGSKSGHAYCDLFQVISYFNGKKTHYSCVLEPVEGSTVSEGNIYELAVEDTDETGLEVIVPVDNYDVTRFHKVISEIMDNAGDFPVKIKFTDQYDNIRDWYKKEISVPVSENIKVCVEERFSHESHYYRKHKVRMGLISYPIPSSWGETINDMLPIGCSVIIDVPVGTFSLPISREIVEDTESNFNNLKKILDEVKVYSDEVAETIDIGFRTLHSQSSFQKEIFSWTYSELGFPSTTFNAYSTLQKKVEAKDENGDPTFKWEDVSFKRNYLVVIPNNSRSCGNWKTKLAEFASEDPETLYIGVVCNENWTKESFNIVKERVNCDFELIDIKKLRGVLRKRDISVAGHNTGGSAFDAKYVVNRNGSKYKLSFDELEEQFTDEGKIASPEDCNTFCELEAITVENSRETRYSKTLFIPAKRMYDHAISLGFYATNDPKITKRYKEIREKANELTELKESIRSYSDGFGIFSPVKNFRNDSDDIELLERKAARAKAIQKVFHTIRKEDTARGEVLRLIDRAAGQAYRYDKLSRSALRTILKIK